MKELQELELKVSGMTCDSCATHVRKALSKVEGVIQVDVPSWKNGQATVQSESGVSTESLVQAVEAAGYGASLSAEKEVTVNGAAPDFALIVIGTGGAGMAAAIKAAEMGHRVGIVEAGVIGGTCVNIGCVPSKTLLRAAEAYHKAGHHGFLGVETQSGQLDWSKVVAEKDRLVGNLRQQKYVDVLRAYPNHITLIRGRAHFASDGSITVDGNHSYRARKVVIATGASSWNPPIEGIDNVQVLNSTTAMELPERPESLLVVGGRFIALEQAQLFARFGTKVTILQRSSRLIPDHEPEVSQAIATYFEEEGIAIHTGVKLGAIREEQGQKVLSVEVNGEPREFRAEQILMAMGRRANTAGLGLDAVGVNLDDLGAIIVDDHMRTSNPDIYAAGDVSNRPQLVYVAAAGGGVAADNALNGNARSLDLTVLPDVIFTDPQIARVGLTEAEAQAAGHEVKTAILPLEHVPRALAARDTRGLIKLVADKQSDQLLGASILAAEGGEVIQTAAMAIRFGRTHGFTVREMREMLFPYLVQTEGLKLAALTFDKDVSQLSCCAG
ncbi:MAG: mercury(II) reductase [SAR324 cluster bacterium]|nr:mercury(II) reductase [SAR324 cluster bacterium]